MGKSPTFTPPALPDFYTDPLFSGNQDYLNSYGKNLLELGPNSYYRDLVDPNSQQAEDVLGMTTRDIQKSGLEAAAKAGTRSGAVQSATSRAIADASRTFRWDNLQKAMDNKKFFFEAGGNMVTGVRDSALNYGGQKNDFALNRYQLEYQGVKDQYQSEMAKKAAKDAMWSQIISSGIGLIGTVGGAMIGGPVGASVGGSLGSALGSSVSGSASSSGTSLAGFTPNMASKSYYNF